jgi:outer membrane biosynthesis protein TonB
MVAAHAAYHRGPPTTEQGHHFGVLVSVLFHGLIFAATLLTFHQDFTTPEDTHVVPVDLVTIANKTNVTAQAPPQPSQPDKIEIPPTPLTPPPEPELQEVEPAPVPPMPEFKVAKDKPPQDKPVETKKQQQQDFNALLNKLTTPDKPVKTAKAGPRMIQGIGAGNMMTAELADLLRSQIKRCWSPNVAAPNPDDTIVDYDVSLNPDGTVARLAMTAGTAVRAAANGYTRAAADAASRAIYECQPYKLPQDRYNVWREITPFHFDPRQMMEQ